MYDLCTIFLFTPTVPTSDGLCAHNLRCKVTAFFLDMQGNRQKNLIIKISTTYQYSFKIV